MVAPNDTQRRVDLVISAQDQASATIRQVSDSFKESARQMEGVSFESLKGVAGRGSTLFEISHLLEGGGVAIGARLAAGEMAEITKKAVELENELARGKITSGEMAEQLAKEIPILGQIIQAGENINELLTGQKEMIDLIAEADKESEKVAEFRLSMVEKENDHHRETLRLIQQINRESAQVGLTGPMREQVAGAQRADEREQSIRDEAEKRERELVKDYNKQISLLHQQQSATQNSIDAPREQSWVDVIPGVSGVLDVKKHNMDTVQSAIAQSQNTDMAGTLKLFKQQKAQAEKDEQDALRAAAAAAAKEQADAQRQAAEERIKESQKVESEIVKAREDANIQSLRDSGKFYEADKAAIQQHLKEAKDAIEQERQARLKAHPEDSQNINWQAGQRDKGAEADSYAAQGKAFADEHKREAEAYQKQQEQQKEAAEHAAEIARQQQEQQKAAAEYAVSLAKWREENVTKLQREESVTQMRMAGKETEAIKAENANQLKDHIAQINEWKQQQIAAHPEKASEINKDAADAVSAAREESQTQEAAQLASRAKEFKVSQSTAFTGDARLESGFRGQGGSGVSSDPAVEKAQQQLQATQGLHESVKEGNELLKSMLQALTRGGVNALKLLRAP